MGRPVIVTKGGEQPLPPKRVRSRSPVQVGSLISKALALVGVTEDRVSTFLGRPCGCRRRREKLNRLSNWAWAVLKGEKPPTEEELDKMMGDG